MNNRAQAIVDYATQLGNTLGITVSHETQSFSLLLRLIKDDVKRGISIPYRDIVTAPIGLIKYEIDQQMVDLLLDWAKTQMREEKYDKYR